MPEGSSTQHRARARRDKEPDGEIDRPAGREAVLDPLSCQMALPHSVLPSAAFVSAAPASLLPVREDLQSLLTALARRVAWGGDRRKGSARIELSEGALAGATLLVHTDERAVSVEIELPGGASGMLGLEQRILERLEGRGFAARVRVE